MEQNQALSISRVARRLNVCDRTVRRIIGSGQLRAYRIGQQQWRVFEKDLNEYLAKRANQAVLTGGADRL